MGDSVGYWDGDIFRVKTRDFHPQQSFRGSSNEVVMTEEFFELLGPEKIHYRFTIEDSPTCTPELCSILRGTRTTEPSEC